MDKDEPVNYSDLEALYAACLGGDAEPSFGTIAWNGPPETVPQDWMDILIADLDPEYD